ncbi:rRNA maturation RNase YbeY [Salinibius halmophilus]|uniref:rRNA maturation RNase YbeY n=1 Tax=Salinibius halmophilus TaxID=1853216 RepID=UPI000E6674D0|nr:rRNA maturation RNase YbeY [Salinibius halmophilus]
MSQVYIERQISLDELPSDTQIEQWISAVLNDQQRNGDIAVQILSADEIRVLNRDYRAKDKATNVLSFPAEAPPGLPVEMFDELGDLFVCAEVVSEEAQAQNKHLHDHWAHMIIHGTLHLLGYDHIDAEEAEEMEAIERKILATFGISDPYFVEKL